MSLRNEMFTWSIDEVTDICKKAKLYDEKKRDALEKQIETSLAKNPNHNIPHTLKLLFYLNLLSESNLNAVLTCYEKNARDQLEKLDERALAQRRLQGISREVLALTKELRDIQRFLGRVENSQDFKQINEKDVLVLTQELQNLAFNNQFRRDLKQIPEGEVTAFIEELQNKELDVERFNYIWRYLEQSCKEERLARVNQIKQDLEQICEEVMKFCNEMVGADDYLSHHDLAKLSLDKLLTLRTEH